MAYNPYANASYKANTVATYSPGELVVALFDGAILNLNKAKLYIQDKDIEKANVMLTKSQKIVRHLNASLDMGYPISSDLRKLYTYFDEQIIQCNLRKDIKRIDDILPMLEELKDSFAQADKISRQQAAPIVACKFEIKLWYSTAFHLCETKKEREVIINVLGSVYNICPNRGLTFGGGYAMLPILQKEVVEKKQWATSEELMDYYAVGQCTPGIIAVNTATFVGNKVKGVRGGIVATLGVVFPSLIIITIIAAFISNFAEMEIVKQAFNGVRVCVCVLIINALYKLLKKSVMDMYTFGIFVFVALGSILTDISPIVFVLISALLGILAANLAGKEKIQ